MPRPKIVIVGAGFGGLFAARFLGTVDADVTVVDRHNYHLFQPLLYQVAVAGLAPSDVAWPIRSILSRFKNVSVLMGEASGIDLDASRVRLADRELPFDYLIVATGATHSYFGQEQWARWAPGLKSIDDATEIRRRVLDAFERAEAEQDAAKRECDLTFVVVGAGPTGVELAGTIAELARYTLAADFRKIDPRSAKVVLLERGPRILPSFDAGLAAYAEASLARLGVDVRVGTGVSDCNERGVVITGELLPASTIIWAAGVVSTKVADWLGVEPDQAGRVAVGPELSVPGRDDIFVIGDAAAITDTRRGGLVPGIAPAAKQQGRYVADLIKRRLAGDTTMKPFAYRHLGSLATIGRRSAVIDFDRIKLKGRLAWWFWGIAHIYFLLGVPSPLVVSVKWLWEYMTYGRGARLITGRGVNGKAARS